MENKTLCNICEKEIMSHEPKFLVPNKHVDVPISHFICCSDCAKKQEGNE